MKKRVVCIICVLATVLCVLSGCSSAEKKVIVGGKSYTEAILCSEIIAQLIESGTDIKVERKFNMASAICFESVKNGDMDIYPDYTGSMMAYLDVEIEPGTSAEESYKIAKEGFNDQFNLIVLESMGFNNTYANAIRADFAEEHGIKTNSDLIAYAPELVYGAEHAFYDRNDGYFNMCEMYGYEFKSYVKIDNALRYASMEQKQFDVTNVYTTDGLMGDYDLVVLEDDLDFFPPYYSCPVVRADTLKKYPEIETVLAPLKNCATEEDMVRYNNLIDSGVMTIEAAAAEFIKEKNLAAQ